MPASVLRMIALIVVCLCDGSFAVAYGQERHVPAQESAIPARSAHEAMRAPRLRHNAARTSAASSHADSAPPYKADRLSSRRVSEPILNIPGQTTVLTRDVLDDMKATSVRDALRSTAGVTIGR